MNSTSSLVIDRSTPTYCVNEKVYFEWNGHIESGKVCHVYNVGQGWIYRVEGYSSVFANKDLTLNHLALKEQIILKAHSRYLDAVNAINNSYRKAVGE